MDEWLEDLDKCEKRGWYFEIEPEESGRLAADIRKVLTRVEQLEAALVFISGTAFSPREDDWIWIDDETPLGQFIDMVLQTGYMPKKMDNKDGN